MFHFAKREYHLKNNDFASRIDVIYGEKIQRLLSNLMTLGFV